MTTPPLVYIIILNWNGWQDTLACVESCRKLAYPNFRLLIVDNGSTDGSEVRLRERLPSIELLQTGANLGFAGGNNAGIGRALREGAAYIWLLNNDAVVDRDSLGELVRVAEEEERLSIVGSKIYYYREPDKIWFAGGVWSPNRMFLEHRGVDETDSGQYETVAPVYFVSGCSLLISAELLGKIGMLGDEYFLYWEDTDLCARAHRSGASVLYVPKSKVWHKIAASTETKSYVQGYYYSRNRLLFYRKYAPSRLPFISIVSVCGYLRYLLTAHGDFAAGFFSGMRDFAVNRFGRRHGG